MGQLEVRASMRKIGGLRKRWLLNTVGVVCVLGILCVMAVTASFSAYYYSNVESDLRKRAEETADFFADYLNTTSPVLPTPRPLRIATTWNCSLLMLKVFWWFLRRGIGPDLLRKPQILEKP